MFDVFYIGKKPGLFAHERGVDNIQQAQELSRTRYFWVVTYLADYSDWDFLWEPPPWQANQRHAWASQWQKDSGTYLVPKNGFTDTHYHDQPIVTRIPDRSVWQIPEGLADHFDYSWHPDFADPPMTYQFGTQWQKTGGPTYFNGSTTVKYITEPRSHRLMVDPYWEIPEGIDLDSFDWTWHPDDTEEPQIYQFGTQWQKTGGPRYVMPGSHTVKYITEPRSHRLMVDPYWEIPEGTDLDTFDWTWHPDSTEQCYIYQFGTQWQKTGGPRYVMPGSHTVKYISQPRCTKQNVDPNWEIPEGTDLDTFDWTWHPDSTEQCYIYQFGTQHQRTGGPRYLSEGAQEIKFVDQIRIRSHRVATAVVEIDHLDGHAGSLPNTTKISRYFDNYLDTLKRIAKNVGDEHEFIWICSSVCDYSDFDFSWHPEQWQATMLHVFASNNQKFGDTFFMHVPTFKYRADSCQLLEWYDVNFVDGISVPRKPMPVIHHSSDSHVNEVKTQTWAGPLALFTAQDRAADVSITVPLWRDQTRTIVPLSQGASSVIVPRSAVSYVKTQLYDYPYIDRTHMLQTDHPLDIVFIANGEHGADHHWHVLHESTAGHQNRLHRVDGINGRVAAYQSAAQLSHTPWFFAVFAKLQVNQDFDWSWQPDRMQEAKHYIFHAYNPVNHLVYGHQAMIAYNRRLVLENTGHGLDFTLDDPHEVVPVMSGTAYYDNDPWTCWRTAFRECIKLRHSLPDVENEYRLAEWLSKGDGVNGHWSMRGAQDAVRYYEEVQGDFAEIKKSYEWSWLASYAMLVQPELVTQSRT